MAELEKPAILGGKPVRQEKIYYGRQWVEEDDVEAVTQALYADLITSGPRVSALEKNLCELTGAKYATVVSNGTAALHVAALAAGIGPGDEVITTPLTFAASANCAIYCGARPVFADVDAQTYQIDPEEIERKITDRTRAVVAVDYTGAPVDHRRIREICDRHHLTFIEDAAHAIGTKDNGEMIGNIADLTCFSFHQVKTVTAGEGGAVTTNDAELARMVNLLHSHGIEHEEAGMVGAPHEGMWYYEQQYLGFNYRMTDFQAALLSSQLKKLPKFQKRRKEITERYNEAFADVPQLFLQKEIPTADTTRHLYMIRLNPERISCSRAEFFNAMSAENVQCQVHYVPVYWFPYYQARGYEKGLCPRAEEIYSGIMSIPLYPMMSDEDVADTIHAVKKLCAYYAKE